MAQLRRRSNPTTPALSFVSQSGQNGPSAPAASLTSSGSAYRAVRFLRVRVSERLSLLLVLAAVQCAWVFVDRIGAALSWNQFDPPKVRIVPTASSPLPPIHFYDQEYTGPSRAFPLYEGDFCGTLVPQEDMALRTTPDHGLLFVKEMKTASTTLSGVAARIARNTARRQADHPSFNRTCTVRFMHIRARRYRNRKRAESFLWSFVREPTARLLSKFLHFGVSREGKPYSVPSFRRYMADNEVQDLSYYFKSLTMRPKLNPYRNELYRTFTEEILESYDFIGVTERMEESLAVLQILLELPTEDLLYLSAKTRGSYDYYPKKQVCTLIPRLDDEMMTVVFKKYLYGEEFEDYVSGDIMMYQAVNKSLDLTIEALGHDRVDRGVEKLRIAQEIARKECLAGTKFPCTADGEHQADNDCLQQDVACGHRCLDRVGETLLEQSNEFQALAAN